MKKEDVLKKIDEILKSDEVLKDDELKMIFSKSRISIENDEFRALGGLSNSLSLYLMTHQYVAPKNVIEFATFIAKVPHQERGKGSFLKMLAMSLVGLG